MNFANIGVRMLVRDYDKMYDFYADTLGLQVVWGDRNGPYTSFAQPGNAPNLAIFTAQNMEEFEGFHLRSGAGDQVMLVVPCADVDADYARLKAASADFVGEPQTIEAWGMRCVILRDPDGNLIELNNGGSA